MEPNGFGMSSPYRQGRYSITTPTAPSNPLAMFVANAVNGYANAQEKTEGQKTKEDYEKAFLRYKEMLADPNSEMNQAKISNLNARTGQSNSAADKIRLMQDQNMMKDLNQAQTQFTTYVNHFVTAGLGGLPADPNNPKVQQLTEQAKANYAKMAPDSMTLITNAHFIRADIASRNPTLAGLTQQGGAFAPGQGAQNANPATGAPVNRPMPARPPQGAPAGLPPLPSGSAPAPVPMNPVGHPQGNLPPLPAPGNSSMGPMPQGAPQAPVTQPPPQIAQAPMSQPAPQQGGGQDMSAPPSGNPSAPSSSMAMMNPNMNGLGDNPNSLLSGLPGGYGLG